MATEQVKIADQQAEFIRQMVSDGRFGDVSEVIRAGVSLLEERIAFENRQKNAMRELLDKAFASGVADESFEQIWDTAVARYTGDHA